MSLSKPFSIAFLNGQFAPLDGLRISPLDRGFLFGDGIYEVIPAYNGRLFRLDEHLDRLEYSLGEVYLDNPYSRQQWQQHLTELVTRNGGGDQSLYLQVTRGADVGRDHLFPRGVQPTVFAIAQPFSARTDDALTRGVAVITAEDIRWQRCDIKSISLLGNLLHREQAAQAQVEETLLINNGLVTEGSSSTLFVVDARGTLITPPQDHRLLPGITRGLILELARAGGIDVQEADIPVKDFSAYPEVWITSSLREVLAVTTVDGRTVGDGKPGPVWHKMHALLQDFKRQHIAS